MVYVWLTEWSSQEDRTELDRQLTGEADTPDWDSWGLGAQAYRDQQAAGAMAGMVEIPVEAPA